MSAELANFAFNIRWGNGIMAKTPAISVSTVRIMYLASCPRTVWRTSTLRNPPPDWGISRRPKTRLRGSERQNEAKKCYPSPTIRHGLRVVTRCSSTQICGFSEVVSIWMARTGRTSEFSSIHHRTEGTPISPRPFLRSVAKVSGVQGCAFDETPERSQLKTMN